MMLKDVIYYKDKKIKTFLKNGNIYTGEITSFSESCIRIEDKYSNIVTIALDSIISIDIVEGGFRK